MESFERSTKLTDGQKWPLLGFFIVAAIANIIGAILLVVGLLITIPVTMIAFAHIYLKLKAHADHAPAHAHEGHEHHDHSHERNHDAHDHHDHSGHSHEENR
jgi:multisubunit Na+/H+ antiporter MnhG subunit